MSTEMIHAVRDRASGHWTRVTDALRRLGAAALGKPPQHPGSVATIVSIDEDHAADTPRTRTSASGG